MWNLWSRGFVLQRKYLSHKLKQILWKCYSLLLASNILTNFMVVIMLLYRNCEIHNRRNRNESNYISHNLNATSGTVKVNVNLLIDIPLKCHELLNGCFKMGLFNIFFINSSIVLFHFSICMIWSVNRFNRNWTIAADLYLLRMYKLV